MTLHIRNKLPDDNPIKRGMVVFVPKRIETAEPNSTPPGDTAEANSDPMQPALDQIENALRAKIGQDDLAERSNDTTDLD